MSNSSSVLYIGAIPYNWDVQVIKSVVCGSGPIVDVRCMMDNAAKNKGFCFVEYLSPLDALNALTVLSKVKIEGRKKMRIELSKEGLRNSQHLAKPTLKLNRLFLPANVILPNEMKNAPENIGDIDDELDVNAGNDDNKSHLRALRNAIRDNNEIKAMVSQMLANGMDLHQISTLVNQLKSNNTGTNNTANNNDLPLPLPPSSSNSSNISSTFNQSSASSSAASALPIPSNNNLINASSYLPLPTTSLTNGLMPVDPVSKTLSTIPPGVLIELLAKLKLVLSNPNPNSNNYAEAIDILNENPKLAVAAAQALLLMGVVDLNVLNQAQQQSQIPLPPPPPPPPLNSSSSASNPPLQQQHGQSQQQPPPPQQGQPLPLSTANNTNNIPPEWLMLPQHTVAKLLQLNRNEANLIFQVLQLSPDQIAVLPPNERNMANQIRGQYL